MILVVFERHVVVRYFGDVMFECFGGVMFGCILVRRGWNHMHHETLVKCGGNIWLLGDMSHASDFVFACVT